MLAVAFVFAPAGGTWVFERFGPDVLWYGIGALGPAMWVLARMLGRYFDEPSDRSELE